MSALEGGIGELKSGEGELLEISEGNCGSEE
jgi:hypothetical protein